MADVVRTIAGWQNRRPCAKDWRRCHRKRSERGLSSVPVSSHAESQGIAENRRRRGSTIRRCDAGLGRLQATRSTRARRQGNGGNGPKALESNKVPLPEPASGSVGAGRIQDFTAGRGPGGGANVRRGGSALLLLLLALSRVGVAWKMRADRHLRWSGLPPATCRLRNWSPYRACVAHGPSGFLKAT